MQEVFWSYRNIWNVSQVSVFWGIAVGDTDVAKIGWFVHHPPVILLVIEMIGGWADAIGTHDCIVQSKGLAVGCALMCWMRRNIFLVCETIISNWLGWVWHVGATVPVENWWLTLFSHNLG